MSPIVPEVMNSKDKLSDSLRLEFGPKKKDPGWGFSKSRVSSSTTRVEKKRLAETITSRSYEEPIPTPIPPLDLGEDEDHERDVTGKDTSYHIIARQYDEKRRSRLSQRRIAHEKQLRKNSISAPPGRTPSRLEQVKKSDQKSGRSTNTVESMDSNKYKSYEIITPLQW